VRNLLMTIAATLCSTSVVNAADSAKMSFNHKCNRPATQVMGPTRTKTTAPRASPAHPLQQPPHPPLARSRGEEGTVVMEIFVTETGAVSEVRIATSSGSAELDAAAMQVTQRWRLTPGTVDGIPVCMWGRFAVTFSLATAG
jgi:TonB family protein